MTRYAWIFVVLAACCSSPVRVDASPPGPATCSAVCSRAAQNGCKSAQPTPAGASCETVCESAQHGVAPWDLGCRSGAASCAAMDACP